jgi:hypothetical protein
MRAFPNCKKRGSGADLRVEAHSFSSRTAQDATTGDRIHLLLRQSSGYLVFFLSRAFLLICGSKFQAIAHDATHHVFMTLPAYTSTIGYLLCNV